ncbi:MAG: VCBS repeat-containing protein, partial [Solirubrobacterales bacterium]
MSAAASAQLAFAPASDFDAGNGAYSVTSADFNNDGIRDLATANGNSSNLSVLLGTGTGSFDPASNFAAGNSPTSVTSADFNGDGVRDLASANFYTGN